MARRRWWRWVGGAAAAAAVGCIAVAAMSPFPPRPPVHFWVPEDATELRAFDAPSGDEVCGWEIREVTYPWWNRIVDPRFRVPGEIVIRPRRSVLRDWLLSVGIGRADDRSWTATRWEVTTTRSPGWAEFVEYAHSDPADAAPDPALAGVWQASCAFTGHPEWGGRFRLHADGSVAGGPEFEEAAGMRWSRVGDVVLVDVAPVPSSQGVSISNDPFRSGADQGTFGGFVVSQDNRSMRGGVGRMEIRRVE